jgi:hypothetical protein
MVYNRVLKRKIPQGWRIEKIENLLSKTIKFKAVQINEYLAHGIIPVIDQGSDFIAGYTLDEDAKIFNADGVIVFGDHTRILKYVNFPFARGADRIKLLISNHKFESEKNSKGFSGDELLRFLPIQLTDDLINKGKSVTIDFFTLFLNKNKESPEQAPGY